VRIEQLAVEVTRDQSLGRARGATDTFLTGRRLALARLGWGVVAAIAVALVVRALPFRFQQLRRACPGSDCVSGSLAVEGEQHLRQLGLNIDFYAAYVVAAESALVMAFFGAALLIIVSKSDDRTALASSFVLVIAAVVTLPVIDVLVEANPAWQATFNTIRSLGLTALLYLVFIFPNGELSPRWTRPVALLVVAWGLLVPFTPLKYPGLPWMLMFLGWLTLGTVAQAYRYARMYGPVERQQTKLVVFGFGVAVVGLTIGLILPPLLVPGLANPTDTPAQSQADIVYRLFWFPLFALGSIAIIPFTFAIAVLRHRLWNVDPVINRALVYGILTASLILVYLGSVVVIQRFTSGVTGEQADLAIVGSTLVIAALFQPMRRRIQATIDRRFYRNKYDSARALARFSATIRDEVNLNILVDHLESMVKETVQPAHVSVWLRPERVPPVTEKKTDRSEMERSRTDVPRVTSGDAPDRTG
jgi:hypothetical protein